MSSGWYLQSTNDCIELLLEFFCEAFQGNCIQGAALPFSPCIFMSCTPNANLFKLQHMSLLAFICPADRYRTCRLSYQMLPDVSTPHAHCLVPWPNRSPQQMSNVSWAVLQSLVTFDSITSIYTDISLLNLKVPKMAYSSPHANG